MMNYYRHYYIGKKVDANQELEGGAQMNRKRNAATALAQLTKSDA